MDDDLRKAGLLLEAAEAQQLTAEAQQQLAETHQQTADTLFKRLDIITRFLPGLVGAVEKTLAHKAAQAAAEAVRAEVTQLRADNQHNAQQLQAQHAAAAAARRRFGWTLALGAGGVALVSVAATIGTVFLAGGFASPDQAALPVSAAGLRGDPAVLAEFARQGVQMEVALCGEARRPCVRLDPKGGTYNQRRDTYLLLPAK